MGLWLPEDLAELYAVTIPRDSTESETNTMLRINTAAGDWVDGRLDTGTFQDILEDAGFDDPDYYLESTENFLDRLVRRL